MPGPRHLVSSPLQLAGRLSPGQLGLAVAADALARADRPQGDPVAWTPTTLAGDLAGQLAVERELARQGLDRATLGRAAFVERVRAYEKQARDTARADLATIGIVADLDEGAGDHPIVVRAARTAFVRLYEAGLVQQAQRVVDLCSRCGSVVDAADAERIEVPATRLRLGLPFVEGGGRLAVDVLAPELLPGAVAVAVPEGHDAAGREVVLPLVDRVVPVAAEPDWPGAALVVPAHDGDALEVARRLGLTPVRVLDVEGVVRHVPLEGLARYAARAAATDLLMAEGSVEWSEEATEPARRCRSCSSVLLPRLGRHWFLEMGDLEGAAADMVREGSITFVPAIAREEFLERAGSGGPWCLSHQLWAGLPVPVSVCADCGQVAVAVGEGVSCGKCMGTLVPDEDVLDARFVGAVWPLASAGWPGDEGGPARLAGDTVLLVPPRSIARWALPMAALGLRLAGVVPFGTVSQQGLGEPGEECDVDALVEAEGVRVVRAALLAGDLDLETARALVVALDDPPAGETDVEELAAACEAALAAGAPGAVLSLAAAAVAAGVRAGGADRVRALVAPLLAT